MRRLALAVTAALLVLYSCSDTSIFLGNYNEPAGVRVLTVPSGSVLVPGDEIPIRIERGAIHGDESTPDHLVVQLLDLDGVVLAEDTIESVDHAVELPSSFLPDLPDGIYQIAASYYDGEGLVSTDTVTFFISPQVMRITRVTAYPPALSPGASGLLRVTTTAPAGTDPYLAWYISGELQEAGYLSTGAAELEVSAPDLEGVYPVRVELYPFWSEKLEPGSVEPPVVYTSEIYVSDTPALSRTDLAPEQNYLVLYHLSGDLRDTGARAEWFPDRDYSAVGEGDIALAVDDEIFGYQLDSGAGLLVPGAPIPSRDGVLTPFSISLRLEPAELGAIRSLVVISTVAGDAGTGGEETLSLLAGPDGRVGISLTGGDGIVWSQTPMLAVGVAEAITVSLEPVADGMDVTFFAGGLGISTHRYPLSDPNSLISGDLITASEGWSFLDGVTRIGGNGGFAGIVDEFGVYFRDDRNQPSAHSDVYASAMRARFGDRLVYAEGFETSEVPDDLTVTGEVSVSRGQLVITEGSVVRFPDFRFQDEDLVVDAAIRVVGDGIVRFSRIDTEEEIASLPITEAAAGFSHVVLRFTDSGSELAMTYADSTRNIALSDPGDFVGLQLELEALDDPGSTLLVRDVLAYADRPRIPEALLDTE